MKKFFIYSLICTLFGAMMIGCETVNKEEPIIDGPDINGGEGNNGGGSGKDTLTVLSPDQQKDYWVEIGTELAEVFTEATLESVTPLVDLSEDLAEKYISYKWGK